MSGKRQKNQNQLAFWFAGASEACFDGQEGTVTPVVEREAESPAGSWQLMEEVVERLESTEIRGRAAHAAKLVPSVRDRSSRSWMNFTRIEVLAAVARNSGRVLRRATATTCSEGASPGRMVRIQEPKD